MNWREIVAAVVLISVSGNVSPARSDDTIQSTDDRVTNSFESSKTYGDIVQLRGRNVPDDWAALMQKLQLQGHLKVKAVPVAQGDTLCSILIRELNLPGCSSRVVYMASRLNGGDTVAREGMQLTIPDYPLVPSTWTVTFDTAVSEDAYKLGDFEHRWADSILERSTKDTRVQLKMTSYDVVLDRAPEGQRSVTIDRAVPDNPVAKEIIIKNLRPWGNFRFAIGRLDQRIEACQQAGFNESLPVSYYELFEGAAAPTCINMCNGDDCPEITMFDTPVFRHAALKDALEVGGLDGPAPVASSSTCTMIPWSSGQSHGTMLASIMAARPVPPARLAGLAPNSRLLSFSWSDLPSAASVLDVVNERANEQFNSPQLFVFASSMLYDDELLTPGGALVSDEARLNNPPAMASVIKNGLIWVQAVGQPNAGEDPHQINKLSPETPMNLGDQRSVIVVTSCDPCSGPNAKVWTSANYSDETDNLVSIAAPGGTEGAPIPGIASHAAYSKAWGTSQAASVVGGVSAALLSCYPDEFNRDGRFLKTRLLQTSEPFPRPGGREKGLGILNIKRAFLEPSKTWLDLGGGPTPIFDFKLCKDGLRLKDKDGNIVTESVDKAYRLGQIVRVQNSAGGSPRWTATYMDIMTAKRLEFGPGTWDGEQNLIQIKEKAESPPTLVKGYEIQAFVPSIGTLGIKPEYVSCAP